MIFWGQTNEPPFPLLGSKLAYLLEDLLLFPPVQQGSSSVDQSVMGPWPLEWLHGPKLDQHEVFLRILRIITME